MIPISYEKMTLSQFIEVKSVELNHKSIADKRAALIQHFVKKPLGKLTLAELQFYRRQADSLLASFEHIKRRKPKKFIWVKLKRFQGLTDATKLCNNQYTLIKTLCKDGQAELHINKLAALIFYRAKFNNVPEFNDKEFNEISELMLSAKVGDIVPTVFFYSKVSQRLNPRLESYFLQAQQTINEIMKEIQEVTPGQDSWNNTGGTM